MSLPNVADGAIAEGRCLPGVEFCHVGRRAVYPPRGGRIKGAQNVQKRALTRAGLAHYGNQFTRLNFELKIAEQGERSASGLIGFF